jgi:hypothetical protein
VGWSALPNQLFLVLPYVACFSILVFYSSEFQLGGYLLEAEVILSCRF